MPVRHILVFSGMLLFLTHCSSGPPDRLGPVDGGLRDCPSSPNCVSSGSKDPKHYTDPLRFQTNPETAWRELTRVIETMDRSTIIRPGPPYMHAEFRSRIFRFVDDVEFWLDADNHLIQVRSASRIGYSDLGVNRKRVEEIRREFDSGLSALRTPAKN